MSVETLSQYGPAALAALAGVLLLWPAIQKLLGSAFDWSTSGLAALFGGVGRGTGGETIVTPAVALRDEVADPLWRMDKLRRLAAWCRAHDLTAEATALEGTAEAMLFTPDARQADAAPNTPPLEAAR